MPYISNTDVDRRAMLESIGRRSLDELFSDIPAEVAARFQPIGLAAHSELEVADLLSARAGENGASDSVCFLGGGIYDHYIPSIVRHMTGRSEFYTAYTPYQPEISQGTLTAMFEFQTLVCELTGMEIANASMYDGATALAEAVLMAERIRPQRRVAVAASLFPHLKRVLETYCWATGLELLPIGFDGSGQGCWDDVPADVSCLVVQSPNAFGILESLDGVKERLGEALLVVSTYPISLGLLEPPGRFGADVVVAEGQSLGLPMGYGGPLLGLFATRKSYLRQLPGRVAGMTLDADGKIGFTMAAQTREQHIRRERATSNICTNSALCALAATVYLAAVGARGLRRLAEINFENAHELATRIAGLNGYELAFQGPFFNEFVVRSTVPADEVHRRLHEAGLLVDSPAEIEGLGVKSGLRFAVTERRTSEEIDRLVEVLGGIR
jgi:glycine dehydrogenase subunit 1